MSDSNATGIYKLFGREPALWLSLISSLVMLSTAFGLHLSPESQGAINASSLALFGLLTAWFVARDGLQAAILGFAKAGMALAISFGLQWPVDRQSAAMAAVSTIIAMFVRSSATAPVDEAGKQVAERSALGSRGFAAISLTLVLTLVTGSIVATAPLTMKSCDSKSVSSALNDADGFGQSFLSFARQTYAANDPRLARVELFASKLHEVAVKYPTLTDAEGQIALLPTLNFVLTMFRDEILPLMNLSPTQKLIAFGIDAGLRIAANHFVNKAADLIAASPAARSAKQGKKGTAVAMESSVATEGVDVDAELEKTKAFLATPKVEKP